MRIEYLVALVTGLALWLFMRGRRIAPKNLWADEDNEGQDTAEADEEMLRTKGVKMFMTETCPHCKKAFLMMEEICREHPEYKSIKIKKIDETKKPNYAAKFDYYYVPTFYVGGKKMHEGSPTKEALEKVYAKALQLKRKRT